MPKIEITELDLTTPGVLDENFDVVYIPGFVNLSTVSAADAIPPRVPTLFTSMKSFTTQCGTAPATFESTQDYRSLNTGTAKGFSPEAVPFDNVMFRENDPDPSYIMAKELLAAGMNVIYERVNPDDSVSNTGIVITSEATPAVGAYIAKIPAYRPISASVPPVLYKRVDTNILVGSQNCPTFYMCTTQFPESGEVVDISGKSEYELEFEEVVSSDLSTDEGAVKFNLSEVTLAGDAKGYEVTPQSYIYIKAGEYYSTNGTTSSGVPYVYDARGNRVTTDCPAMSAEPITEYPEYWDRRYHLDYYERTTVDVPIEITKDGNGIYKCECSDTAVTYAALTNHRVDVFAIEESISIVNMYKSLTEIFNLSDTEGLVDRGNYNIKYLTSGGYPVYEYNGNSLMSAMLALAEKRGDCVALIDHTDNPDRENNVDKAGSLYKSVTNSALNSDGSNGEFGAMFTPWCVFNRTTSDRDTTGIVNDSPIRLAGSFAYLGALADSIKTNAPWLAIAGSSRGALQNLSDNGVTTKITNGAADWMQPRSSLDGRVGIAVNAITDIKPYGNVIWGNRTLKRNDENLVATSFLNVRNLISDVKKICYRTARKLTFEQNNDILWVNFKAAIAPTLDRMVSGYGISGYKFVRDTEHERANEKATLCAKIYLYPVYAVEDFYVTVVLQDDDEVTVQ